MSKAIVWQLIGGSLFGIGIGWLLSGSAAPYLPVLLMGVGTLIVVLGGRAAASADATARENGKREPAPPPGYRDVSIPMERINGPALWLSFVLLPLTLAPFVALYGGSRLVESPWSPQRTSLGVLIAVIVLIVVHEAIHAITWVLAAGVGWHSISFGFAWKALSPYAHVDVPIPARAYRIGTAMPGLLTGVVPGLVALLLASGPLMLVSAMLIAGAVGDAIVLWVIRDVPGDVAVLDHPTAAGCYVQETE